MLSLHLFYGRPLLLLRFQRKDTYKNARTPEEICCYQCLDSRIILEILKNEADTVLRDHRAGFRQDRGCIDHIATLRIIVEQSMEFDLSLYIKFVEYEKAFDSIDRDTLWKLLQNYGVPEKIVTLIRNTYDGMTCKVTHAGRLTESFQVKTGVRQGCLLSPFMFLVAIDWLMKTTT